MFGQARIIARDGARGVVDGAARIALCATLLVGTAAFADAPAAKPAEAVAPPASTGAPLRKSVAPAALAARLQSQSAPIVLDVRTPAEFAAGHVPGAINVQHDQLQSRLAELAPYRDREVVLYCRSGKRAGMAADVLRRHGFERLEHLDGDMPGWEASGQPVQKP